MAKECTVPDLGENVESATVVEVFVQPGDSIAIDQAVLSLETDKAEFEMPTNVAGKVTEVLVAKGDEVKVGQAVLRVEAAEQSKDAAAPEEKEQAHAARKESSTTRGERARSESKENDDRAASAREGRASRPADEEAARPKREKQPEKERAEAAPSPTIDVAAEPRRSTDSAPAPTSAAPVAAAPSVRRLARELGVDLASVAGSGPGGRISSEDVSSHVRAALSRRAAATESVADDLPDFSRFGPVEVEPMSKVRRRTAEQMQRAWSSIPHVTHHDKADVTELDRLRRQFAKRVERAGGKLTMTAVLLKVLGSALRKFPKFNASVDMANHAIVYKKYVHLGVAVDTDRGLLVPVIRDVDEMNIVEISLALKQMSEKARGRNIKPEELAGASFTITNLGGIGGTAFSPLINPPEVAVLGVASARLEPVDVDGTLEPRLLLPLSVSYDHRVIDGADAARFLRWVCEALAEPFVMDLEGE